MGICIYIIDVHVGHIYSVDFVFLVSSTCTNLSDSMANATQKQLCTTKTLTDHCGLGFIDTLEINSLTAHSARSENSTGS